MTVLLFLTSWTEVTRWATFGPRALNMTRALTQCYFWNLVFLHFGLLDLSWHFLTFCLDIATFWLLASILSFWIFLLSALSCVEDVTTRLQLEVNDSSPTQKSWLNISTSFSYICISHLDFHCCIFVYKGKDQIF